MKRIRVAKIQPKSWKISSQNLPKSQEYHTFFSEILNFCLTDINIYLINIFLIEKKNKKIKKSLYFLDFRSDPEQVTDPDPLFHGTDPRIRIHTKMAHFHQFISFTNILITNSSWNWYLGTKKHLSFKKKSPAVRIYPPKILQTEVN